MERIAVSESAVKNTSHKWLIVNIKELSHCEEIHVIFKYIIH